MSKPEDINSYKGHQIILNSDRLIFNSKADSIFNFTNKAYVISAQDSVHINVGPDDSQNKANVFRVNAPCIELGLNNLEPILLGDKTVTLIKDIISDLQAFSTSLSSAVGAGVGTVALPEINAAAAKLNMSLATKLQKLESIKSTKNFTQ